MLLLQRRDALAQFVYDFVEMTDCIFEAILEAINSIRQACISALRGRLCWSIWHEWLSAVRSCSDPLLPPSPMVVCPAFIPFSADGCRENNSAPFNGVGILAQVAGVLFWTTDDYAAKIACAEICALMSTRDLTNSHVLIDAVATSREGHARQDQQPIT